MFYPVRSGIPCRDQEANNDKSSLRYMTDQSQLYTIGYSPHTLKGFVDLLKRFRVTALADVRSKPYFLGLRL